MEANVKGLMDLIQKSCSTFYYKNAELTELYRGVQGVSDPWYGEDPAKQPPRLGTTEGEPYKYGLHNLVIDNSPLWWKYPRRNLCVIASTSEKYARQAYAEKNGIKGNVYRVIPLDDAMIAVCPKADLSHTSFYKLTRDVYSNLKAQVMNSAHELLALAPGPWTNEQMKRALSSYKADDQVFESALGKVDSWKKEDRTVWNFLTTQLDPVENEFQLLSYENFTLDDVEGGREVWTGSKCLLIEVGWFETHVKPLLPAASTGTPE